VKLSVAVENRKMAPISIKRILISESVDPCCKKILQENGIQVTEKQNMSKDDLIAEIKVGVYIFD
jgi:D-3-phosphoglycerate dehydrogenase